MFRTPFNPLYTGLNFNFYMPVGGAIWPPLLNFFWVIIFGFYMGTLIGLLVRVSHKKYQIKIVIFGEMRAIFKKAKFRRNFFRIFLEISPVLRKMLIKLLKIGLQTHLMTLWKAGNLPNALDMLSLSMLILNFHIH